MLLLEYMAPKVLNIPKFYHVQGKLKEKAMEELLRQLSIALLEKLSFTMDRKELDELIDIVKFSEDPQELEEVLARISNAPFEDCKTQELMQKAKVVAEKIAQIAGKSRLEVRNPKSLAEAIEIIQDLTREAESKLDCIEKEKIEHIKEYVKGLIHQIGSRYKTPDAEIIVQSALERIERDTRSIFNPEIYKRIQDLIIEREKELEFERAKVRERLKVVIKSIVDSLNSLGESENSIVDSLHQHVTGIESIIQLDNIEEITEKLTQLSKDLRRTINKVKREIGKTKQELEKTQKSLEELKTELEKYREKSIIDELTQVLNRRGIMEILQREFARSKRFNTPLSVGIVDLDDFKKINDTYGHLIGDKVLKTVASIIKNNLRITDAVGRYGGEEFLIVLPDTDSEAAEIAAEKLRKAVEKKVFKYKDETFKVTISIGIAQRKETDTLESLLQRADEALYLSKKSGKNRITIAQ